MRMWKNMVQPDTVIWLMQFACCIPKATDIHSEFVILIAFLWHQKLRDRARVTFIHPLYVLSIITNHSTHYHNWHSNQKATWTI